MSTTNGRTSLSTLAFQHEVALRLPADQLADLALQIANAIQQPEYLTPDEICERLKITRDTLAAWERSGVLVPSIREGRVIRYTSRDLDALQRPRS